MFAYLILGMTYAFAAAVQPGPLQSYLISQTLSHGWRRTLPAAFSPLISDGPVIALALLVLSRVPAWLAQGLRLALAGTVLGIAGALFATRLLSGLLFAVKATDVLTFAVGPLILIAVAALASFLPACRAAMVDPVIALRHE